MLKAILCLLLPLFLTNELWAQKNKKRYRKKNSAHLSHHKTKAHTHKKEHQVKKDYAQNRDKQGRTILTGPRGGRYYINSKGNKVYVPKR